MKTKEVKNHVEIIRELSADYTETGKILKDSMKDFPREASFTKKLWREKNQSALVKIGVALILFPDPTISDVLGSAMVAAGLLHNKIKNSGLYLEDIYKTYPRLLKELHKMRQDLI